MTTHPPDNYSQVFGDQTLAIQFLQRKSYVCFVSKNDI